MQEAETLSILHIGVLYDLWNETEGLGQYDMKYDNKNFIAIIIIVATAQYGSWPSQTIVATHCSLVLTAQCPEVRHQSIKVLVCHAPPPIFRLV